MATKADLEAENAKLKEYLHAAATDYLRTLNTLRSPEFAAIFSPAGSAALKDLEESSELLKRAIAGEDIWTVYQSEMDKLREMYESKLRDKDVQIDKLFEYIMDKTEDEEPRGMFDWLFAWMK